MPSFPVKTYLDTKNYKKFKQKTVDLNSTPYKLAQRLIIQGLDNTGRTPLSDYSTLELLQEVWKRVP